MSYAHDHKVVDTTKKTDKPEGEQVRESYEILDDNGKIVKAKTGSFDKDGNYVPGS